MKQKLLTALLTISCIANVTLCYLNISKNPTIITESVQLEESYDEPSWGEIHKNNQQAIDEYQKQVQANIDLYNQQLAEYMNNPQYKDINELYKAYEKAEKENVVKNIAYDSYGKIKVSYANGKSDTIDVLKGAPTSSVDDVTVTKLKTNSSETTVFFIF